MPKPEQNLSRQVANYYQVTVYAQWLLISVFWLTLGIYGIFGLRQEFALWLDHFTWSAFRYGLVYNPIPSLCVLSCVVITVSVLIGQSRHILWGISAKEKFYLEQKTNAILAKGARHPLWKRINR